MRVPTLTGVAVLIQLCLAELQEPLGDKSSENDTPLNEAFNKRVEWALEHYNIPGLAVGVVRDGQEFAKGYGFANITSGAPVTADTLFFAGSTTKAHTAAAISLLVDDNTKYPHIQWDTPVYSLIPEVFSLSDPYYTTHITITDMLSHRSGLPRHDTILLQNLTTKEILLRMKHLPLTAEIRTESQYCNLMYITAAYLVESVTGHSLDSFLHENIWSVLGMTSTTLDLSAAKAAGSHVAEGYYTSLETNKSIPTNQAYTPAVTGAGNILTSAADYNKWISTLLAQNLPISKSGYNALFSPHSLADPVNGPPVTPPFGSPNLYGFGWFLQTYKGERIIQHGGAQVGFGAFVLLLPDRGFGLSILGNDMLGTNDATQILAFELIDTFLGLKEEDRFDWAGVIDDLIHKSKLTNTTLSALYPSIEIDTPLLPHPLNLSAYAGTYTHPAYPTILLSTHCPVRKTLNNPEKWTGARLCLEFENPSTIGEADYFDLFHVSGMYWTGVTSAAGTTAATRVAFRIEEGGGVGGVGVEFDDIMARRGEKIWFTRVE